MLILGLDPGIADTGFGVVKKEKDKFRLIECGSVKTKAGLPLPERLGELRQKLSGLIKKHRPDTVAVEELFFAKNAKTAIAVAQARGVLLATARENGCAVREFTPLEVKMAITGYGRADKNQIQQMVKTVLSLQTIPKPDDAADALAVAICCGQTKKF